ncbi:MAG: acyl carrier protein [Nitrospirae bacterium]|nr:MAG: acyl carrier protein [Nitrospirota bacterium]
MKLTAAEIAGTVLRLLGEIAPEADLTQLNPEVGFRDQLDIDSMDFLNFVIALHEALHIEIPEADYSKLSSLTGCVNYVMTMQGGQKTS